MDPQPYNTLSPVEICALCVWREARGEGMLGKRGVAHVILNRTLRPGWWGTTISTVILFPFQFSSFNAGDPNEDKWPADNDPSFSDSLTVAEDVLEKGETDLTAGATSYYSVDIPEPEWAKTMILTLAVGRLKFYKLA